MMESDAKSFKSCTEGPKRLYIESSNNKSRKQEGLALPQCA